MKCCAACAGRLQGETFASLIHARIQDNTQLRAALAYVGTPAGLAHLQVSPLHFGTVPGFCGLVYWRSTQCNLLASNGWNVFHLEDIIELRRFYAIVWHCLTDLGGSWVSGTRYQALGIRPHSDKNQYQWTSYIYCRVGFAGNCCMAAVF